MVVILLFLHNLRGTVIVSLAIPACVVATFLVYLAKFNPEPMTLRAVALRRHSGGRLHCGAGKYHAAPELRGNASRGSV